VKRDVRWVSLLAIRGQPAAPNASRRRVVEQLGWWHEKYGTAGVAQAVAGGGAAHTVPAPPAVATPDYEQVAASGLGLYEGNPCGASNDFGLHLDLGRIAAEGLIKRVGETFDGVVAPKL
jgi:hypothetical protein